MKLSEATKLLESKGYTVKKLNEAAAVTVESVVKYLIDNYELKEDRVTVQGNELSVLSGNGKEGFLKVVTGDDGQIYITFLDDNGIPSIKPGALISDFSDIDDALA